MTVRYIIAYITKELENKKQKAKQIWGLFIHTDARKYRYVLSDGENMQN